MLQTDAESRRRLTVFFSAIMVILLGIALPGLWQRYGPLDMRSEEAAPDVQKIRAEAKRMRAVREQLAMAGQAGKWSDVISLTDQELKKSPNYSMRFLRAEALFYSKDERAAANLAELVDDTVSVSHGARLVLSGKRDEYLKYCQTQVEKLDPKKVAPDVSNNTAWLCVYGPDVFKDYKPAVDLAKYAVANASPNEHFLYLNTLGAIRVRAHEDEDGIKDLMACEKNHPDPFNWAFLAMAHDHLGDKEEAKRWQAKLDNHLRETFGKGGMDTNRHELLLFQEELRNTLNH